MEALLQTAESVDSDRVAWVSGASKVTVWEKSWSLTHSVYVDVFMRAHTWIAETHSRIVFLLSDLISIGIRYKQMQVLRSSSVRERRCFLFEDLFDNIFGYKI